MSCWDFPEHETLKPRHLCTREPRKQGVRNKWARESPAPQPETLNPSTLNQTLKPLNPALNPETLNTLKHLEP